MGLANLAAVPPHDHASFWDEFWFNNWNDHELIQDNILDAKMINYPLYPIIPWVASDANSILLQHQLMHNNMNNITMTPGNDLTNLNFKDPESIQEWVYNHYQEHLAAHTFLDI